MRLFHYQGSVLTSNRIPLTEINNKLYESIMILQHFRVRQKI